MKNTIILIAIILFSININSQNLVGAWERTQKNELGTMEKQIVIFSSNGFQSISIFNAESGEFIYTNGGTWELSGDDLTEKIEFYNGWIKYMYSIHKITLIILGIIVIVMNIGLIFVHEEQSNTRKINQEKI